LYPNFDRECHHNLIGHFLEHMPLLPKFTLKFAHNFSVILQSDKQSGETSVPSCGGECCRFDIPLPLQPRLVFMQALEPGPSTSQALGCHVGYVTPGRTPGEQYKNNYRRLSWLSAWLIAMFLLAPAIQYTLSAHAIYSLPLPIGLRSGPWTLALQLMCERLERTAVTPVFMELFSWRCSAGPRPSLWTR